MRTIYVAKSRTIQRSFFIFLIEPNRKQSDPPDENIFAYRPLRSFGIIHIIRKVEIIGFLLRARNSLVL